MILSMTGFGKANMQYNNTTYTVEVRSLNSKSTDIRIKLPSGMSDKEVQIRKIVTDSAVRGRIELFLSTDSNEAIAAESLNKPLFKMYYNQLNALKEELKAGESDLIAAVMRIPNVVQESASQVSEEEWAEIEILILNALKEMRNYRIAEGKELARDLGSRVNIIESFLPKITPFEQARILKQKDKLRKSLEEYQMSDKVDQNRFEQELIYYLEKIDITEEKIRLAQHCQYFKEQLMNDNEQVGKILAFISQEMGREINTLGSKAQDFDIQQIVVIMKDELEKVKEQLANIL